jgi:hypothetical protein
MITIGKIPIRLSNPIKKGMVRNGSDNELSHFADMSEYMMGFEQGADSPKKGNKERLTDSSV